MRWRLRKTRMMLIYSWTKSSPRNRRTWTSKYSAENGTCSRWMPPRRCTSIRFCKGISCAPATITIGKSLNAKKEQTSSPRKTLSEGDKPMKRSSSSRKTWRILINLPRSSRYTTTPWKKMEAYLSSRLRGFLCSFPMLMLFWERSRNSRSRYWNCAWTQLSWRRVNAWFWRKIHNLRIFDHSTSHATPSQQKDSSTWCIPTIHGSLRNYKA